MTVVTVGDELVSPTVTQLFFSERLEKPGLRVRTSTVTVGDIIWSRPVTIVMICDVKERKRKTVTIGDIKSVTYCHQYISHFHAWYEWLCVIKNSHSTSPSLDLVMKLKSRVKKCHRKSRRWRNLAVRDINGSGSESAIMNRGSAIWEPENV